jgi:hypothetical protein
MNRIDDADFSERQADQDDIVWIVVDQQDYRTRAGRFCHPRPITWWADGQIGNLPERRGKETPFPEKGVAQFAANFVCCENVPGKVRASP